MEKRYACLIVSAIALVLLSIVVLVVLYREIDADIEGSSADKRVSSSASNFGQISLRARETFAAQLDGKHTDDPNHWLADGANSTLRQVFLVVRHGDRLPSKIPPRDPLRDKRIWSLFGLGGLTNIGKARQSLLGKLVRYRYSPFLGNSVNKQIRTSRSSAQPRCFESAQAFLSSFLALSLEDSVDAALLKWDLGGHYQLANLWQPADIETLPMHMDGMLAPDSCKYLFSEKQPKARQFLADLQPLHELLNASIGLQFHNSSDVSDAADLVAAENFYYPDEMDRTFKEATKELTEKFVAYDRERPRTQTSFRLRVGLLLNDILANMRLTQMGVSKGAKKLWHYSTHDHHVYALLGALKSLRHLQKKPDFASNLAIELHEQQAHWFVRIFYMQQVPSDWTQITLASCNQPALGGGCSLDEFERVMEEFRLTSWQQWMSECNNSYADLHPFGEDQFLHLPMSLVSNIADENVHTDKNESIQSSSSYPI